MLRAGRRGGRSQRRWLARAAGAALLTAAALSVASGARAAEPAAPPGRVAQLLSWHAPAGCGSATTVQARVRELLGGPELALADAERVDARVSETTTGWALRLRLGEASAGRERVLEAEHCADLVEAAAVAISLAFEAAGAGPSALSAGPGEPAPAAPEAAVPPGDVSSAVASEARGGPSSSERARPKARAGAELAIDLNALAATAAGPSLFVELAWDALSLGLLLTWLPGADKRVGPAQSVEFSLLAGGLRACYALARGLVDTSACAGLDAGQLSARGAGLIEARVVRDVWLATQAGIELSRALGAGLSLQARGELVVPLRRQGYAINDTEAVHRVAPAGARVGLGARVTF